MKLHTLAAAVLSLVAAGAFAQTAETPKVDARQAKQEARIDQGVASGQLTAKETKKLEAGQAHVDRVENRAKADGTVTKAEKARIAHEQNQQSRRIKHQKHDKQSVKPAA